MFERFTDRARYVLVLAEEEARTLGHAFVGAEHILLGLVREGDGVAARALASLGISSEAARHAVRSRVPPLSEDPGSGARPFTPQAKRVLELSLREALQLGHQYIGTEHLLLALAYESEGPAAEVLRQGATNPSQIRARVVELLGSTGLPPPSGQPWFPRMTRVGPPRASLAKPPGPFVCRGEVSLVHRDGRLTGQAGGQDVDLALDLPGSEGTLVGRFGGPAVEARWRIAPNGLWEPDRPAALRGLFAGQAIRLLGWFHIPDFSFDRGTIDGEVARRPVAVTVERIEGDGSFVAHGTFMGDGLSLSGSVRCGFDGQVEGAVSGRPVRLHVGREEGERSVTVTGAFEGPGPLLLVLIAVLVYFV